MTSDNERVFCSQLSEWDISLTAASKSSISTYARLLSDYDEANVIGTRDPGEVILKHVLDSLSCLMLEPVSRATSLIDIGSGAGLPGIPLKLACPELQVALLESTGKKVRFLHRAIELLGLKDARPLNIRAEIGGHRPADRARYDIATSRALASLPVVVEYCVPFVKVGGYVVAMKGAPTTGEIADGENAAREVGARISEIIEVPLLPEIGINDRRLVIIEKISDTPARYPRQVGVPRKHPLVRPSR